MRLDDTQSQRLGLHHPRKTRTPCFSEPPSGLPRPEASGRGASEARPGAPRIGWRVRYQDPDSGKTVKETLDPSLTTSESRADWAVRKSRALAKRRLEIEQGAPRATRTALGEAIEGYYRAHPRLRASTLAAYRNATDKFLEWCGKHGVKTTDDITRARLLAGRETLVSQPKHAPAKGGKRGARKAREGAPRSAFSINRELASVRAVLGYLGELDLPSRVRQGDLRRGLRKLPTDLERVTYLRAPEIAALLAAAERHDNDRFAETRAEHAGEGERGLTARHDPIAPFVLGVLLSGMRVAEAISLDVSELALDGDGAGGGAGGARGVPPKPVRR